MSIDNAYQELTMASLHAVTIEQLLQIHRDPFDRILVAQFIVGGITLLTVDPLVAKYPGLIQLV